MLPSSAKGAGSAGFPSAEATHDRCPSSLGEPSGACSWHPWRAGSGGASGRLNQNVDPYLLALWTPDLPLMLLNDCSANRQSQAESDPGAALHFDALDPVIAFPDALLFPGGDPWPFITDLDPRLLAFPGEAHRDRAIRGGIFERIGQVVGHDLPQAIGIRQDGRPQVFWVHQQQLRSG